MNWTLPGGTRFMLQNNTEAGEPICWNHNHRFKKYDLRGECKRKHVCQICLAPKHPWYICTIYRGEIEVLDLSPA